MTFPDDYIGLPYKLGGCDRGGLDCYGLVCLVYAEQLGIDLPRYICVDDDPESLADLLDTEKGKLGWVEVEKPAQFDVVNLRVNGYNSHVGIVIDRQMFLHSWLATASAIDFYQGPRAIRWRRRIAGFYRHGRISSQT